MRLIRPLTAALALPALTTVLLIPAAPATAAPTAALQTLGGYCSEHDDPAPQSSTTGRVSLNEPVGPYDRHSGFAEAASLSAGSYVKAQRNTSQPNGEDCDTQVTFRNVVQVLPGTTGMPNGTPVTLRAVIDVSAELGSTHDGFQRSSATSSFSASVAVEDPGAACDEQEWCSTEVVHYRATAERDLDNVDPAWSESGLQGLHLGVTHSWYSYGNAQAQTGAGDNYSKVLCATFPCLDAVPGEYAGPTAPLSYAPGQRSVLFDTHVGARLIVRGKVVTSSYATYGSTTATSRTLSPLSAGIQQTDTTGLQIVVGDGAVDEVDPTTSSTVDVGPNTAGWNDDDVAVTISASDAALTGISYSLVGASSGSGSTSSGSIVVPVTEEGTTTVSWTAVDAAGNTADGARTVRIDRTAPAVSVPVALSRPAQASGTAVVHYPAGATDPLSGLASFDCTRDSGDTFPLGETTVVCTAVDRAGNDASRQFVVTITEPTDVYGHLAALRELITLSPMDEVLRRQLLNDLVLLEKAYEKGRGITKGCKELDDLQARVTATTSISSGTKSVILARAAELDVLLGC